MKEITLQELQLKLLIGDSSFKLVNALEPSRFRLRHIPGSLNLFAKADIEKHLGKDDEIVIYCSDRCCARSISLYHQLSYMGYKRVSRFAGGLIEWERNNLPLQAIGLGDTVVLN